MACPGCLIASALLAVSCCFPAVPNSTAECVREPIASRTLQKSERPNEEGAHTSERLCGRNGLFMYLRLLGHERPYSEVEQCVPVGHGGTSLLELRNAADDLGVSLAVYKREPCRSEVEHLPPCIALLRTNPPLGGSEVTSLRGHYILVERSYHEEGETYVEIVDGLCGIREAVSVEDFANIWTGYYLSYPHSRWQRERQAAAVGIVAALFGGFYWLCRRLGKRQIRIRRSESVSSVASVLVILVVMFNCCRAPGEEVRPPSSNGYDLSDGSWQAWRVAERDAANSLYIVLRHCGIRCSYEEVCQALGPHDRRRSLLEISRAARRMGMSTSLYRGPPASMRSFGMPIIVYVEGSESNSGGISVVLPDHNGTELTVIDGQTAQLHTVGEDDFRRLWSGVMLVPEKERRSYLWMLSLCVLTGVVLTRLWGRRAVMLIMKRQPIPES